MTGIDELRDVAVVSAAPDAVRVSVFGKRTQLDVALPADLPVAAFLPELARMVGSRDVRRDEDVTARDERRTFWVLSRVDDDAALAPDQTLRAAGVKNGELLRLSQQRALSPPTLYDDVVDAAARLNRASYAAWNATAASLMAFAGLWLGAAVWVYFLMADAFSAHRDVVVGGAVLTTITLVGGAALAHRTLGLSGVAAAVGWPAIVTSAALGWVVAAGYGEYGLAAACAVLLALTAVYYRVIGTGHSAYMAASVVFTFGGLAVLGRATGGRVEVLATLAATIAVLGCVAVPVLTARLGRFPAPTVEHGARKDRPFDNPTDDTDSGATMPSAEEVWARVRSAALTRAGLLAGLAAVVVVGAAVLMSVGVGWPPLAFAVVCAAVLALRSRRADSVPERAALAVPATALVLIACVQAQSDAGPVRLGGIGVLVALAMFATLAGLVVAAGRRPRWVPTAVAYLEYATVAALIPLSLWPLGLYDRLGL
ncbi:type VII secretion integral membrane protein EccD [Mycobacterium sp.]|uniref:type VII secretion integral membrane protein EccD n=1 Tax=Mycobacterium sp. TaxID=1785 RepID=UPI002D939F00|nr:type VII secretion integral membrane protein EccD [Mycobacterium sp.]